MIGTTNHKRMKIQKNIQKTKITGKKKKIKKKIEQT